MKTYTIYFEIYGKKMKADIMALSEERAKEKLRSKIIFHKIEVKNPVVNIPDPKVDFLMDMFNMKR